MKKNYAHKEVMLCAQEQKNTFWDFRVSVISCVRIVVFFRKLSNTGLNKRIFLTPQAETKTFFDSCVEGGSAMLSKNHKVGKVG